MPDQLLTPESLIEFVRSQRAFSLVSESSHQRLAREAVIRRAKAGEVISEAHDQHQLHLVLKGQVKLEDENHQLCVPLQPGELFGYGTRSSTEGSPWQVISTTDSVLLHWPPTSIHQLLIEHPALAFFLTPPLLSHAEAEPATALTPTTMPANDIPPQAGTPNLTSTPIKALLKRLPITLPASATIQETALAMREQRVSSVLLVEQEHLFGLVTDRDLRNRVVAEGLDIQRPVHDIATLAPLTVDIRSPAFDALLLMARHNIHHVPVMDGHRVAGMLTATDLTEQHSTSAVFLAGEIYKQTTLEGLKTVSQKVQRLQQSLSQAGTSAYNTGHILTAITDAITVRLLQLGEARLGPAPVDYVWVAAGSQARNEQTAKSDQDNCMILDDIYQPTVHGEYFRELALWVCDGLNACGYIHCPGEMMAMTDTWRQPRQRWLTYFDQWTGKPDPKALMLTCVFFDLRAIHGTTALLDTLRHEVAQKTRNNSIFLAYMVSNALSHQPPLGMFGNISVTRSHAHTGTVDLKHNGIVPIVDLARVYALAGGLEEANTHDRLTLAAKSREISPKSARDLSDALEFMATLRIHHQVRQTMAGQAPDNHLKLDDLSNFERAHLKDAFQVVKGLQAVLSQRYQMGRF
jgi:CBS domain-containing protein